MRSAGTVHIAASMSTSHQTASKVSVVRVAVSTNNSSASLLACSHRVPLFARFTAKDAYRNRDYESPYSREKMACAWELAGRMVKAEPGGSD